MHIAWSLPQRAHVSAPKGRPLRPLRLTLAAELGGAIDGAWWPYGNSVAHELAGLVEALRNRVGGVLDVSVNWSALDGVPNLDARSPSSLPGTFRPVRNHHVITVTGDAACAKIMVVPARTSRLLATMVLRHAADLPITALHRDTDECRIAADLVAAARRQNALPGHVGG